METAVWASLYHNVKNENPKFQHQFCPAGEKSWCSFKRVSTSNAHKSQKILLDTVFLDVLKPMYTRLSNRDLLFRCLRGFTQNANESLNSFVWTRSQKHRFFGKDRILLATAQAVLAFNDGSSGLLALAGVRGTPIAGEGQRILAEIDKRRLARAKARAVAKKR